MVPGWKFISDPPTKLLPALDFIIVWSLIIITTLFLHPTHPDSVLTELSNWCATEQADGELSDKWTQEMGLQISAC